MNVVAGVVNSVGDAPQPELSEMSGGSAPLRIVDLGKVLTPPPFPIQNPRRPASPLRLRKSPPIPRPPACPLRRGRSAYGMISTMDAGWRYPRANEHGGLD